MYDYRRMTPEQRKAIVEHRRSRGFPLHRPPHLDQGQGWYFITAATYEHKHHFAAPNELTALERQLLRSFQATELLCGGWVMMPNHYHTLVQTSNLPEVGRVLRPVHGRSAHYANKRDGAFGRQVWHNYSDRKVRSERHFWACLHYILYNPVKHKFAAAMPDWPWSCFQEMLETYGQEWIGDLGRTYPLGDFGQEWDD